MASNINSEFRKILTQLGSRVANDLRAGAPTSKIRSAVSVGAVKQHGSGLSITVSVDMNIAPEAAAYEWGSGIHATLGPAAEYPIRARNVPNLVFFWERMGRWFVGPQVSHPGVRPKPYIQPAVDKNLEAAQEALGNAAIGVIIEALPDRIGKKK